MAAKKPAKAKEKKDTVTFSLTLPTDLCKTIDTEADEQERSRHAQVLWIVKEWAKEKAKQ